MQLTKQSLLWVLVALALVGCQRTPVPPTKAPPTPTQAPPAPTPLPLINGDSGPAPTMVAPEVPRITIDELKAILTSPRNVLVIDTRDPDDYETAHIRGAINVPYSQVEAIAPQLSRSAKVVFYCA